MHVTKIAKPPLKDFGNWMPGKVPEFLDGEDLHKLLKLPTNKVVDIIKLSLAARRSKNGWKHRTSLVRFQRWLDQVER